MAASSEPGTKRRRTRTSGSKQRGSSPGAADESKPVVSLLQMRRHRFRNSLLFDRDRTLEDSVLLTDDLAGRTAGIQGQCLIPTGIGCWNRRGSHTFSLAAFLKELGSVVRTWGQRCTLHVYTPRHWPVICAAVGSRLVSVSARQVETGQVTGRTGKGQLSALEKAVDWARGKLEGPDADVRLTKHSLAKAGHDPKLRYRVFMTLAAEGAGRLVHMSDGADPEMAPRVEPPAWSPPEEADAFEELARVYFGAYGPATSRDFSYWLGSLVGPANSAIRRLVEAGDLVEVSVKMHGDRMSAMFVAADQYERLVAEEPGDESYLSGVRLLGRFDPCLLAHHDKEWLLDEDLRVSGYNAVWGSKNGMIGPALLVDGSITGSWAYKLTSKGLEMSVSSLRPLQGDIDKAVQAEAEVLASMFFEKPLVKCELTSEADDEDDDEEEEDEDDDDDDE